MVDISRGWGLVQLIKLAAERDKAAGMAMVCQDNIAFGLRTWLNVHPDIGALVRLRGAFLKCGNGRA